VNATQVLDYTYKWNYRRNRPGQVLSEEEARLKDAAGDEYTAVMPPRPGTTRPVLVTPVWQTGVVVVTFIDEFDRRAVEYVFSKKDDTRLFLDDVHMWTYPNDEPRLLLSAATVRERVSYYTDGYVKRVITNVGEHYKETIEYRDVPVESNWEPIPTFGDYASIARFERGTGPLDDNQRMSNNGS
jgi:hypothetical protein